MPSGYTAALYEGRDINFQSFVLQCARAFGALIEMRDDPWDVPIPDQFLPSSYHEEALEKAKARLSVVDAWSDAEAEWHARKLYKSRRAEYIASLIEQNERHFRYEEMKRQVERWSPPTPDHENLKSFMLEQLESSIRFDCSFPLTPPVKLSGVEYRVQEVKHLLRDIDYHAQHHEEEVERTESRTDWVRALRESLMEEESSVEA